MFNIKFSAILGISAFMVAICAAFFSVYGIATLFAGASFSAMVMASSLEIGKLIGTTFLYRYWERCNKFLKGYLITAILILMVITSMGIFGYLSAAYQKSSIEYAVTEQKITAMEDQKNYSKQKIDSSKKRIDDLTKVRESQETRMNNTLTNEYVSRNPLQLKQLQQQTSDLISDTDKNIKDENVKIQIAIDEIKNTDEQINNMKLGTASKKDVQTFKFVADALHLPLDKVVRWFIFCIIFVFDPLAICLTLSYNVAVYKKEDDRLHNKSDDIDVTPIVPPTPKVIESVHTPQVEIPKVEETKVELPKPESTKSTLSEWSKLMFKI